jgi:hypothetical protein
MVKKKPKKPKERTREELQEDLRDALRKESEGRVTKFEYGGSDGKEKN